MKKFFKFSSLRFLVGGGANTIITYLLYLMLLQLFSYKISYSITYVAGIAIGYLINAVWVFQSRPSTKTALAYPFAYLFQYVLGVFLLVVLVEYLSVDQRFAPLVVIVITLPLMFLMTRAIFRINNQDAHANN